MVRDRLYGVVLVGAFVAGCGGVLGEPPATRPREDTRPLEARLCDWGDGPSCERLCAQGDTASCNLLGYMLESGDLGAPQPRRASTLYAGACDAGYPAGCNNLAWLHLLGKGVPKDLSQAMGLFRRAFDSYRRWCDEGRAQGCTAAADLYDTLGLDDERERVALLERGCALGDAKACQRAR